MNVLHGQAGQPKAPAKGFDTDSPVSPEAARQFAIDGYGFCVRYLSRGAESNADLSYQEASGILAAGLALMPVQHVALQGWEPSAELGTHNGSDAVNNARAVGFPNGVNIWCDLEGCSCTSSAADVIAYCTAWFEAINRAGFVPGLYVGAQSNLTAQQLYENLPFQHYWKSLSNVPAVAQRGYQMVQSETGKRICEISFDEDITQADQRGGQVWWLAPNND